MAVAIAALVIPGSASAAPATLEITSAYVTGPDQGLTFTSPYEEAHYEYSVGNTDLAAPIEATVNTKLELEYATAELELGLVQTNADGAVDCTTVDNAGTTVATCPISDIQGGDAIVVIVDMSLAAGFTGSSTTLTTSALADGTSDTLADASSWDYAPTCTNSGYFYDSSFTRAELQTNGTLAIPITCTDPDGGALTITPQPGTYGTVTGSGTSATFTASAPTLASPTGFYEFYALVLTDGEGDTTAANLQVAVYTQSNTTSVITGPSSIAVPATGSTVTYQNTVKNNGPDAIGNVSFGWEISDKATLVSATANGVAVTCQPAQYGDPGLVAWGCGSAALPAVGSTVAATLTVRYKAGEKGLTIPSSVLVTAIASPDSQTGAEDRTYADNESAQTTALTNYVEPAPTTNVTTGTAGPDTFRGDGDAETFYGGDGNDVFDGGAGSDTFFGGAGDDSGFGGLGDDVLYGGMGSDRLVGGDGTDKLYGNQGGDRLLGSTGGDVLYGGPGNDILRGGTGADRIYCGTGIDIAMGDNGMDLIGCRDGQGGDTISGGYGLDVCVGDRGDRFLSCETIFRLA